MSVLEAERYLGPSMAPEVAGSPEMEPGGMAFAVMGEGYVIEKDTKSLATIVAKDAATAEAVMAKLAELSDRMDGTSETDERFKPLTLADLSEELENLEIADTPVENTSLVEELIGSDQLIRPQAGEESEAAAHEVEEQGRKSGPIRSRLGRALATTALVGVGLLAWASSASAKGLKDTCAPSIFDKGTVLESEMHNPGKNNQDVIINIHVNEVDPQCDGVFKRVIAVKPQIRHHGHKRWTNLGFYDPIYTGDTSPANDIGGVYFSNPLRQPERYFRHGDRVRFLERIQEINESNNKVARTEVSPHRVKVIGG